MQKAVTNVLLNTYRIITGKIIVNQKERKMLQKGGEVLLPLFQGIMIKIRNAIIIKDKITVSYSCTKKN
jgi:hypothetical protein